MRFEVTDHLGNARAVITGQKKTTTLADIVQLKDYYSFGMVSRSFSAEKYRFGNYNGKEMDDEAGWINYGYRNYNPVIGRFDAADPFAPGYPWYSPYQYAGNMPIAYVDLDGLEEVKASLFQAGKIGLPSLSPSEWYSFDRGLSSYGGTFSKAAQNNTQSLKHDVYAPVFQIHSYYQWAANEIDKGRSNIKFFHAAADVTGFWGVGGAYHLDPSGFDEPAVKQEVNDALAGINIMLLEKNMAVIRDIINGKDVLQGKSGREWSMEYVYREQAYVEKYLQEHPMSPKATKIINDNLGTWEFVHPEYKIAKQVLDNVSNLKFQTYKHRVAIGLSTVALKYNKNFTPKPSVKTSIKTGTESSPRGLPYDPWKRK